MANITLRQNSASPLSISQVDNNFIQINNELIAATAHVSALLNTVSNISSTIPIYESSKILTISHNISENSNALSVGSVTVNDGIVITLPSSSTWIITGMTI